MNAQRGLVAGLLCGLAGLVGLPLIVAGLTAASWWLNNTRPVDRRYDIDWWRWHAFPAIVAIPMLLFFAGFVTYAAKHRDRFAKNFFVLAAMSLPLAFAFGVAGMAHPRHKADEHPPMYFSEVLAFFIPMLVISVVLLCRRRDSSRSVCLRTDEPAAK